MRRGRPTDTASSAWPLEFRFNASERLLKVRYDDGFSGEIPFELLRVESPSAETRGHGGQTPPPPPGKKNVGVLGADPVGKYALRIRFDDGHDTGLFTWSYLRTLAQDPKNQMKNYLKRLKEAGLSRD